MKKLVLSLILTTSMVAFAQVKTPKPSPSAKIEQTVGLTDVAVDYSRPSKKGRTIFGKLVPYAKLWRTGANENTKISFSSDIEIAGKTLKKGTYALYTKPNTSSWEVIFYSDSKNWGTPRNFDNAKVALSTKVNAKVSEKDYESFTISFGNLTNKSASIDVFWEKTTVSIPFTVPTNKIVAESVDKDMTNAKSDEYYRIAQYYHDENLDIKKATKWIDKAVELDGDKPKFWVVHVQALIHKKAGNLKSAKKAAELSLKLAKEANYDAYIKKNKELLKTL